MAIAEHKIRTWACPNCPYKQMHDPANTTEMAQIFSEVQYAGRPERACPACYAGENPTRTKQHSELGEISGTDLSALFTQRVADDATLEQTTVEVFDERGIPVMEQVGTKWELRVDQQTGEIYSEEVPVFEGKRRPLTPQELVALKTQRDKSGESVVRRSVKKL